MLKIKRLRYQAESVAVALVLVPIFVALPQVDVHAKASPFPLDLVKKIRVAHELLREQPPFLRGHIVSEVERFEPDGRSLGKTTEFEGRFFAHGGKYRIDYLSNDPSGMKGESDVLTVRVLTSDGTLEVFPSSRETVHISNYEFPDNEVSLAIKVDLMFPLTYKYAFGDRLLVDLLQMPGVSADESNGLVTIRNMTTDASGGKSSIEVVLDESDDFALRKFTSRLEGATPVVLDVRVSYEVLDGARVVKEVEQTESQGSSMTPFRRTSYRFSRLSTAKFGDEVFSLEHFRNWAPVSVVTNIAADRTQSVDARTVPVHSPADDLPSSSGVFFWLGIVALNLLLGGVLYYYFAARRKKKRSTS